MKGGKWLAPGEYAKHLDPEKENQKWKSSIPSHLTM